MDDLDQIRTIALSERSANERLATAGNSGAALSAADVVVVDGILVTQDSDLSTQQASDIRDSLLFAQLAADYEASRIADPQSWYELYAKTLAVRGWAEASHSTKSSNKSPPIDWERALLREFPSASRNQAERAIARAQKLPEDAQARQVWSQAVSGNSGINYAVGVATLQNGAPQLTECRGVARMQFDQDGFIDWTASFAFELLADRRNLNEDVYATLRATVKKRLGHKIGRYIVAVA